MKQKPKFNNCKISPTAKIVGNCFFDNCFIGPHTTVYSSYITDSVIAENCSIGPYAHIHNQSNIKHDCIIGNFVEIKNSTINPKTKIKHLSYIGDALIGENCNIGSGVVFANYNGKIKSKTIVKDNCFIGCNSTIIAPLTIEESSYICAGTVLTKSTNKFDFVIAREKETIKPLRAKKYIGEKNE